jgi:hypothetical protein
MNRISSLSGADVSEPLGFATPRKICMKMETVFFFLSKPASNNPKAKIIDNTKLEATSIQAVSPEFIGKNVAEKISFIGITAFRHMFQYE